MTTDTTASSYWLNWRFLLCATWILAAMVFSAFLIWRYEVCKKSRNTERENQKEKAKSLHKNDVWGTCSKAIHPVWLLVYRIISFFLLLALILADAIVHSAGIFYYYTQWTFTLVTIYFGVGSLISILGCVSYFRGEKDDVRDAEQGSYVPPSLPPSLEDKEEFSSSTGSLNHYAEPLVRRTADAWEYGFQILFQTCAGAVTLTDSVFWLILYPFFMGQDSLHFLVVCMHSVNAVFLLGETFLNRLKFPFFRIVYFVLWTCIFVIFQWIVHACVSMWWPYPFLDLSSPYAPIWYLGVGLLHLPCFAIFSLIFRIKQFCLSR